MNAYITNQTITASNFRIICECGANMPGDEPEDNEVWYCCDECGNEGWVHVDEFQKGKVTR